MIKEYNFIRFCSIAVVILMAIAPATVTAQDDMETVKIMNSPELGSFLTDARGMTLYSFKNDSPGKSECSGKCAETWPVYCYKIAQIDVDKVLKKSDFSSFKRPDNQDHLSYKGMPLYNYSGDQSPGDTKGHGHGGLWFVVKP